MSRRLNNLLGLAPAYVIMLFLMVIPLFIVFYVSLMSSDPYGGYKAIFSLESYTQLFFAEDWDGVLQFDLQYTWIIVRTLVLSLIAVILCLLLSFPVAYFISRQPNNRKALWLFFVTLPFWVSMVVRVYAWIIILADDGVLESGLRMTGLVGDIDSMLYTEGAMLTGMIYSYIPLMILPIYASIEKLDGNLIEAANDLYASRITTLFTVIIPLCKPGMVAGAILVFVPCLGTILEPVLLGGGKKLMLGNLIYMQFTTARNWSFGSSLAIVLLCLVVLILFVNARRAAHTRMGGA